MQMSIHYREADQYLIEMIEEKARRERKSKSSVILSIIETYFESDKRIGHILRDLKALSTRELEEGLRAQNENGSGEPLGRILLDKGYVREVDLDRALLIQGDSAERQGKREGG